ncbi:MAG: hypothetical protein LQ340_006139 [Diploschistes diacapsis]|nr:MAG: hypothetical protein LQ340_006139 [Diploschistes diacapsis]
MPPQFGANFVRKRLRSASLSAVTPSPTSSDYSADLAQIACRILYKSPLPSPNDLPIYILNSAAFPDTKVVSYDKLLPYVLARFPDEEHLIGGKGYEVVFFAGGEDQGGHESKRGRPSFGWIMQAYNVLSRAMRKRLQKLYLVHERRWVRVVSEMFSTIVSPKFRRKVVHASTLSGLALHIPIEDLLIPPSAYYRDRKLAPSIYSPYASGRRAFGAVKPLPSGFDGKPRLPRVLRETTNFLLAPESVTTEGVFRVNARAITLEVLKEAYDRGQKFIVWRDGNFVMTFHQWKEGYGDVTVDEPDLVDGYPVLAAAGLMKLWYSELRDPIFPQSGYQLLERVYSEKESITIDSIMNLIGEPSDWSPIFKANRLVVRMHLLPTLFAISKHAENKMTPKSLALCFAPSLVLGTDPIQDARICRFISQILEFAISNWDNGLAECCGMSDEKFKAVLSLPKSPEDREDPLGNEGRPGSRRNDNQTQGILLVEHSSSSSEDEGEGDGDAEDDATPPPLPPRAATDSPVLTSGSNAGSLRRKPAPLAPGALKSASFTIDQHSNVASSLPINEISLSDKDAVVKNNEVIVADQVASPTSFSPTPRTPSGIPRKPLPGSPETAG